jgi:hypothetical protein
MAKSPTPFLGIELPVPGSAEPFRVADYNAAFTTVDEWAEATTGDFADALEELEGATAQIDAAVAAGLEDIESGLAAGTTPVAPAALNAAVPVTKGGTGGTTVTTARAGLRIYVQSSQPSSPQTGDLWFW